jgi:acetyltransferase-like isoleucine patch superfamily enzyme
MSLIPNLMYRYSSLRTRLYTALIAFQFKEAGAGIRIEPPFKGGRLKNVCLGDKVIIHRDCWLQVFVDGPQGENAELVIKSHTAIGMGATISAAKQVTIGEYVLFARNVYVSDHGHAFFDISDPIMLQGISPPASVSIGDRSWLGQNVCVLPGASIGEHCVIGANSVVTSSIPDFCVAVGAPARVIKQYNKQSGQWERIASASGKPLQVVP